MDSPILSSVLQVRKASGKPENNRRSIALLSSLGMLTFIPISLYQLGVIRHLPDLPGKLFNSDYVNSSQEAQVAGIPDGPVGLLMYAVNLTFLTAAIKKLSKRKRETTCLII